MAILVQYRADRVASWAEALRQAMPSEEIRVWPEYGNPSEVEAVVTMMPEPGSLRHFPNLRFIAATGAGVDALLDPKRDLPPSVPIVKLVDPCLTEGMAHYILATVMRYFRQLHDYEALQREATWRQLPRPEISEFTVGLLGLGALGMASAVLLGRVGFPVAGWSQTPKDTSGLDSYVSADGLNAMLSRTRALVCLLPLTPETRGIINGALLAKLRPGAFLINAARGAHVVERDLLAALESGHIAHATLDVFDAEPLPGDHPYWQHRRVTVTPHVASLTDVTSGAMTIADTLRRSRLGNDIPGQVVRPRGY